MAATLERQGNNGATSSTALTVSFSSGSATAGNLIVACISVDKDSQAWGNITCTGGTFDNLTIIQDSGSAATNVSSGLIAYKVAEGGETGVTFNWTASAIFSEGWIGEFSGLDSTSPLDQSNENESNLVSATSSISTNSITTTTDNQLIISLYCADSGNTIVSHASWTNADSTIYNWSDPPFPGDGHCYISVARRDVTSTGTYSDTASTSGSDQCYAAIASFKEETASSSSSSVSSSSSSRSSYVSSSSVSSSSSSRSSVSSSSSIPPSSSSSSATLTVTLRTGLNGYDGFEDTFLDGTVGSEEIFPLERL